MADRNANIIITLRSNADAETRKLASGFRDLIAQTRSAGATQEQAERQALSHAQALARLAVASGQAAQGERILIAALSQVDQQSTAAVRAQTQLVTIQNRNGGLAQQFGESLKGSFLSILGPAALATAAIATVKGAVESFKDAFTFKVELDKTNESIAAQLAGVRDSGRVFEEARQFAERYKITQAETSQILQNSVGVLRTSSSSVGDLEAALLRLQSRDPSKPISEASRALRELASGDVKTIKDVFNIGAADALRMKNEIAGGADAVQVLTRFLDGAGNGMDVLERRARGVQGALNDAAIANEKLVLAQANLANSAGALAFIQGKTQFTQGLANLLNFDTAGFAEANRALAANIAFQNAYNDAINRGLGIQEAQRQGTAAYAAEAQRLEPIQNAVGRAITEASNAAAKFTPTLKGLAAVQGEAAGAADIQANAERGLANELGGVQRQAIVAGSALAAMHRLQAEEAKARAEATRTGIARAADVLGGGATSIRADLDRQHQAELQFRLASARTDAQRIAILQQELAGTKDVVERLNLQTQIVNLQQSAAKSHTKELNTQLNLEERIADSKEKQLKSAIDARLAINDDAKQRILEADQLRRANIAAQNAKDPRIRALAQLDAERIPLEQAKRALGIQEQLATAGGQIVNGRIFQGQRGAGGLPALPAGGASLPSLPALPASAGGVPIVNVYLDSQPIAARVVVTLTDGAQQAINTGAGR